eukprot:10803997-Alexandrium_andersonii.AAC.1
MSASLVGSEMCIRDSRTTCNEETAAAQNRLNLRHRKRNCSTGTAATPVSYTHLTLPTICSV